MKIKVSKKKIVTFITTFVLIFALVSCSTMIINAEELNVNKINASKIYDIALTKTGVIANKSTIDSVINQTINTIEGTAQSYKQWCEDNGKVRNATTWQEYLESDAYSSLPFRLSAWALRSADIIEYIITGESLTDELRDLIPKALVGSPILDIAKGITIPSDVVEEIRQEFDNYIYEYGDYFYLKTNSPSDLNPLWFDAYYKYETSVGLLETLPGYMYFESESRNSENYYSYDSSNSYVISKLFFWYFENDNLLLSDYIGSEYEYIITQLYDSQWEKGIPCYFDICSSGSLYYSDYEDLKNGDDVTLGHYDIQPKLTKVGNTDKKVYHGIYTCDGRLVKVFRNENAMKSSTLGRDSYYVTGDSQNYVNNTDNSVKVSGDYLIKNANTYSHDVIQNTIDNSENITQETVNNIVNTSSSTIINNYYSSDSGNGGSGGESNSGNTSILDGLGKIISAITEIIGFLLGVLGDIIGLIGSLFTTIYEGIKAVGGIFTGFATLLGELFVFIPQELMNYLVLAIEVSIGIAIWKKFDK